MPSDDGMLFVFESRAGHCFWMRNTKIPLSIAFIQDDGKIVNIENMKPMTEDHHCPTEAVRYALEMNQGWFAKHGIKAGATVEGLLNFTPTRGGRYGLRVVGLDGETALIPLGKIGSAAPAVVTPEPSAAASPSASVATPGETPCILIGGGTWDPPGDDDRAPAIRQESVKLRNVCAESVAVGGWVVHDEGRDHSYTFADGFTFAGGATVMLYSGTGVDTETKLYWGRTRGEVWGQSYPERAYLRDAARTPQQAIQFTQAEAQLLRDANDAQSAYDVLTRGLDKNPDSMELLYDRAMTAAGVVHEGHIWPGAVHGFNNDATPERYNKAAADLAWQRTIGWFTKYTA